MTYTITIHEESPQSLALLELLKTFDFVSIKKNKKKEAALSLEELEEDRRWYSYKISPENYGNLSGGKKRSRSSLESR